MNKIQKLITTGSGQKLNNKSTGLYILTVFLIIFSAVSCQQPETTETKKQQLIELKKKKEQLELKISDLKKELSADDTLQKETTTGTNATLVEVTSVPVKPFAHYIEVQGLAESRQNVLLSAELMEKVKHIPVKEGDKVRKGDPLLILNDESIRNNIEELTTSLELARKVYERQKNLWDQEIGSEIQYLEAKNRKESLEKKLATINSQLKKTVILAPFSGKVDEILPKESEMVVPGTPAIRVINLDNMLVEADVSESYVGKIRSGDTVLVNFISFGHQQKGIVTSAADYINPQNRTFKISVMINNPKHLIKPNLLAVIKVKDYETDSTAVIPTNVIQHSQNGSYIFIAEEREKGSLAAKKVFIETGHSYDGNTEVISGLAGNELLITNGFRDVTDGEMITFKGEPI